MQGLNIMGQNLLAHFCAQMDPICPDCFLVVLNWLQSSHDFSWHLWKNPHFKLNLLLTFSSGISTLLTRYKYISGWVNSLKTFQFIAEDAAKGLKIKLYLRFAKLGHSKKTPVVLNGHYTRNNWNCNSNLATVIHKLKEHIYIIEKLGDNDFTTCINLCQNRTKNCCWLENPHHMHEKSRQISLLSACP